MGKIKSYWPEISFFLVVLLIGLWSHWGKGKIGAWGINMNYVDQDGAQLIPRRYLDNANLVFLFFWIATVFVYLFSLEVFGNRKWSLIAVLIFYCTPILFGIAFWDVVNTPLLTCIIISTFMLVRFIKKPTYLGAILLAFFHVLGIFSHPIATTIPIATLCFILLNFFTRNLGKKDILKIIVYLVNLAVLLIILRYVFKYPPANHYHDFLPSSLTAPWTYKIGWVLNVMPPLWMIYFLFSMIALNVVYFSNYSVFLKSKWIYSYLFSLLVGFIIAPVFLPRNVLLLQDRYIYYLPSIIIIGIAGCYEFAIWVRKRWGEKIYFIFKATFLPVFLLQCIWSLMAIIWLHPGYYLYRNWPLFFMK